MFTVHGTYISKLMIVLMACFPTVVDWIISPSFPRLFNRIWHPGPLPFNSAQPPAVDCVYTLLHWCQGRPLTCFGQWDFSRHNTSIGFKCAWVVWLVLSHSCHSPWEEHVQVAASTRIKRDMWNRPKPNLQPRAEPPQLTCIATSKKNKYLSL